MIFFAGKEPTTAYGACCFISLRSIDLQIYQVQKNASRDRTFHSGALFRDVKKSKFVWQYEDG